MALEDADRAVRRTSLAAYGIVLFLIGQRRWRGSERSLAFDSGSSPEDRLHTARTGAGVNLGLASLVVIIAQ